LDVISLNALEASEAAQGKLRFPGQYVSLPFLHTSYFTFDVTQPPFDDIRLRRAIALATDKTVLADQVLGGSYSPALGGFLPPGLPGSAPLTAQSIASVAFDPDEARKLMREAGYPSGRGFPRLPILATRRPTMAAIRRFLSDSWSEILGIEFEWIELWFGEFMQRLAVERSPIWFLGWAADYPDPDSFMRVCPWRYRAGWQDQQYEQLVETARRVAEEAERLAMYRQAEAILVEQTPVVPLYYSRHNLLVQPRIKNYPIAPVGTLSMKNILVAE
jgi:oligopeptide transport system substrate-binding protein